MFRRSSCFAFDNGAQPLFGDHLQVVDQHELVRIGRRAAIAYDAETRAWIVIQSTDMPQVERDDGEFTAGIERLAEIHEAKALLSPG